METKSVHPLESAEPQSAELEQAEKTAVDHAFREYNDAFGRGDLSAVGQHHCNVPFVPISPKIAVMIGHPPANFIRADGWWPRSSKIDRFRRCRPLRIWRFRGHLGPISHLVITNHKIRLSTRSFRWYLET